MAAHGVVRFGAKKAAQAGDLQAMLVADPATRADPRQVFEKIGKNITLVGPNGVGQTTKVANQIVVALTIEAVAEALVFAAKAGADPAKLVAYRKKQAEMAAADGRAA